MHLLCHAGRSRAACRVTHGHRHAQHYLQGLGRPYWSGSRPGPKYWQVVRAAFTVHPGPAGHTRHLQQKQVDMMVGPGHALHSIYGTV